MRSGEIGKGNDQDLDPKADTVTETRNPRIDHAVAAHLPHIVDIDHDHPNDAGKGAMPGETSTIGQLQL